MLPVTLQPITSDNREWVLQLRVAPEQVGWLPANEDSLAMTERFPDAVPLAVCNAAGTVVGLALYGREVATGRWKIFRLMIDAAWQRRGYGRAAMQLLIDRLRSRHDYREIYLSCQASNDVARRLYGSLGFIEIEAADSKVTARLVTSRV